MKRLNKDIVFTTIMPYFINTGMFEGVEAHLSPIFPMLEQEATIKRITNAILQNEEDVMIPWHMGFIVHFCKTFFSASTVDFIGKHILGLELMADWKGSKKNAIHTTGEKQ